MANTIPPEAIKLKKLNKKTVRYTEVEQFKDSDLHMGYFCYNCLYFMKPNSCAIISSEGQDFEGNSSGIIAPHGICSVWEPNEK
jgi:hypothetical protein